MVKQNIEIIGNQEDVLSFIALCAKIQTLGELGASRDIKVSVDGDGSANLKFNVKVNNKNIIDDWQQKFKKDFREEIDGLTLKTHYIGE